MSFIRMCVANFFLFASIYMLFPMLPVVMEQRFGISIAQAGSLFLAFVAGIFVVGPFHSYLGDRYKRKRVFLYSVFVLLLATAEYLYVDSFSKLLMLSAIQGAAFSLGATAGITVAIDITTSLKRSSGNMAYALAARLGMLIGVATGIWFYLAEGFQMLSYLSIACSFMSIVFVSQVYIPFRAPIGMRCCNFDRFILLRGWLPAINLMLIAFIPGVLLPSMWENNYLALIALLILAILVIPFTKMFVKLSQHCQRGTANTTCYLAMDTGILLGISFACRYGEEFACNKVCQLAALTAVLALLLFFFVTYPYYKHKRIR